MSYLVLYAVKADVEVYTFGESGLLENEPTVPAEQAHTSHHTAAVKKPTRRKVPGRASAKGLFTL
jgi:hypothetical protein